MSLLGPTAAPTDHSSRLAVLLEVALIFAVLALHASWPIPDVNEAHYLGKAKHYWDPGWIPRDAFLDSSDTHLAFYVAFGWITRWLSLPMAAVAGRAITWLLLAWSWQRLSWAVVPRFGMSVLTAALFVALHERMHMAGEWVVGGVEAKGFAYALVFFALAAVARGAFNRAWVLLGAASAFHVLVGGWTVVATAWSWLLQRASDRTTLARMLPGLLIGGLLSLGGLLPALLLSRGVDAATAAEANRIQVFERLPHHLLITSVPTHFITRFALLVVVWFVLCYRLPGVPAWRRLRGVVNGSLVVTAIGCLLSMLAAWAPDVAASLLRFYWFRLSDALVPLGVSLLLIARATAPNIPATWRAAAFTLALAVSLLHLGDDSRQRLAPGAPRGDSPAKVIHYDDWLAACAWVAANTPPDAIVLTPRMQQTFKWHAGRAEVATYKDMPQDAAAVVAWWRRLEDVHATGNEVGPKWYRSLAWQGDERVLRLARKYEATYVLTRARPELALPRVYQNNTYAVYQIPAETNAAREALPTSAAAGDRR